MAVPIREGDIPGIQLRALQRLSIGRAEGWRWLTDPRRLERWLADRAEVEPGPRGGLRLERAAQTGSGTVVETGRTERLEPERSWVLAFRKEDRQWEAPTRLELSLSDGDGDGGGCELDVLQTGFHLQSMSACLTIWEEYRRRWRDALERLAGQTG